MITQAAKQPKMTRHLAFPLAAIFVLALTILAAGPWANNTEALPAKDKIFAQALVETTLAKHPELAGLGLSTTPPGGHDCISIADTDAK